MFSFKAKKVKKKKNKLDFLFITGIKRFLMCINIIKYLVLIKKKRKKKNLNFNFFLPLYNYIINNKNTHVDKIKYKIYRHKLINLKN